MISAATVLGESVTLTVSGGSVMVNNLNVIITDIQDANGVIHVIDAVLIPSVEEAPAVLPVTGGEGSSSSQNVILRCSAGYAYARSRGGCKPLSFWPSALDLSSSRD